MDITISPKRLSGNLDIIPSKSQAHRLMICAAFANKATTLHCWDTNRDMQATAACLNALGANVIRTESGYHVTPVLQLPDSAVLNCQDSGSTLRFMLPVVGALGVEATFLLEGRLPQRPLSPLWEEMERMGCRLSRPTKNTIACSGKLRPGNYSIDGGISSQFITGLLLALPLLKEKSTISITGKIESKPYIDMTKNAMRLFNTDPENIGETQYRSPGNVTVEGDWSNGAFFHVANFMGSHVSLNGLDISSSQGDRAVVPILEQMKTQCPTVDASDIPDLIPVLSIAAAYSKGAVFTNISRLRLKESDRVASVCEMLNALGCYGEADENTLRVYPGKISGGTVDCFGDHRIAMSAAIAASVADEKVKILGAECAAKSYPRFWEEYRNLGGSYEQYLR